MVRVRVLSQGVSEIESEDESLSERSMVTKNGLETRAI